MGANAARMDLDSHHSHRGHHHGYGHYIGIGHHKDHHDDLDDVFDKHSKHHWRPHHLFALIANKGEHGWGSRPFCNIDNGGHPGGGNPSAVPVPAAVWLFGSAALGLLGLKRKQG
ncbi:MAG: PEP-CTERM sorting domain-containing protein [Gammaproteobacteria bacterium]|nr:PEP-CTERM sorting domain-containing protein [Gammaproteobacteria bacterium]